MHPAISLISAHAVNASIAPQMLAKGRVQRQIDNSTYLIKLQSREIVVRIEKGALVPGEQVSVAGTGQELVIVRDGRTPILPSASSSDAWVSSSPGPDTRIIKLLGKLAESMTGGDPDTPFITLDPLVKQIVSEAASYGAAAEKAAAALARTIAETPEATPSSDPSRTAQVLQQIARIDAALRESAPVEALAIPPITVPEKLQEGFAYFKTAGEALRWLTSVDPNASIASEKMTAFAGDGGVIARTLPLDNGQTKIIFLKPEDAIAEFALIAQGTLKSDLWKSISPEILVALLTDKGSLTLEQLQRIDSMLNRYFPEAIDPANLQPGGRDALIKQWLSVIIDSPLRQVSVPPLLTQWAQIPDQVRSAAELAQSLIPHAADLPRVDRRLADILSIPPQRSAAFLPDAVAALGLTLENDLLKAASGELQGDERTLANNLKAMVANLQNRILAENPVDSGHVNAGGKTQMVIASVPPESFPAELKTVIESIRQVQTALDELVAQTPATQGAAFDPAEAIRQTAEWMVARPVITALPGKIAALIKSLTGMFPEGAAVPQQPSGPVFVDRQLPDSQLPALSPRPDGDMPSSAVLKEAPAAPVGSNAGTETGIRRQGAVLIRELISRLVEMARELPDAESRNDSQSGNSGKMPVPARRSMELVHEIRQMLAHLTEERAAGGTRLAEAALRQGIETAMGRLESMQVLARPTPTADGSQQILALPLRVGEEWTQVQVRFVKKEASSRKKSGARTIYVHINAAPSLLGGIDSRMELTPDRKLRVAMEFEKDPAFHWFDKNSSGFIKALRGISGIRGVEADMVPPSKGLSLRGPGRGAKHSGRIDVQG
jgi:hypothetical protein